MKEIEDEINDLYIILKNEILLDYDLHNELTELFSDSLINELDWEIEYYMQIN